MRFLAYIYSFIVVLWWISIIILGFLILGAELTLVSEFVNPVFAWILIMFLGIPFAPILPILTYIEFGFYGFLKIAILVWGSFIYYYFGIFVHSYIKEIDW